MRVRIIFVLIKFKDYHEEHEEKGKDTKENREKEKTYIFIILSALSEQILCPS